MVYYYTSENVKTLRNILHDYNNTSETSPFEYMRSYIQNCSSNMNSDKISWIADCFLGIQKHGKFLKALALHLSEELSFEDQDYFMIIFHALLSDVHPKDSHPLYKCLFNLSKPLLSTLTAFLSNNEVLTLISQLAQPYFDSDFITDNIIKPLFLWQPYISELEHTFAEYNHKIEARKIKPLTVPVQPNVLNHKGKVSPAPVVQAASPATPPNSFINKGTRKMLTKNTIDKKLKAIHEKNKDRSMKMLNEVKKKDPHFAQLKSDKYYRTLNNIRNEMEIRPEKPQSKQRPIFTNRVSQHEKPIKETITTLKRIEKKIQSNDEMEMQWLEEAMACRNTKKIEELVELDRLERERTRLYDIEKKHLIGQISYEEALLAKKKLIENNKRKHDEFLKEKDIWNEQIEKWKRDQVKKNLKTAEKLTMLEFNLIQARQNAAVQKKEIANKIRRETEEMLQKTLKEKQDMLDKKIAMIKEIKILSLVAKKSKLPKIIDLTKASGLGLLCEMSIAELQERLTNIKMDLQEQLNSKRQMIKNEKLLNKLDLEHTRESIKNYNAERAIMRKNTKKDSLQIEIASSAKEISELRNTLLEKRKLRMQGEKPSSS